MSSSTLEQLYVFHAKERTIFSKLVLKFARSPAESLLVMATWLWLEDFGFDNIFSIIMVLPDPLISALANEAVSCFQCVSSTTHLKKFGHIPFTTKLISKTISLHKIYGHRFTAIVGIKNFLTTICSRIFSDILQQILPPSPLSLVFSRLRHPLMIPGFPHPTFGSINVMYDDGRYTLPHNNISPIDLWKWHATSNASVNDRTMFVTFSRGFPVSQVEVEGLFTNRFGENCVDCVYMNESYLDPVNGQQTLFAREVMNSVVIVDRILGDTNLKKFKIHGKHIWARKYEEKKYGR